MKEYPFYAAYTHLNDFYGIVLEDHIFETMALSGWDKIGNKRVRLYNFRTQPLRHFSGGWHIELPCNTDIIEAITSDWEDYQSTSNDRRGNNYQNSFGEHYIEDRKFDRDSLYIKGGYVKYRKEGNVLFFQEEYPNVNILYKGVLTDDNGLPSLNEKEVDAIAAFCAYSQTFKDGLVTRNNAIIESALLLKAIWERKCTQARVPDYLNQNEMDAILNVSHSWDRKRFGKSFKPIR